MKSQYFTALSSIVVFGIFTVGILPVGAVPGTCSWHGGVNCGAGSDWDGSAICNDGWRDSTEVYSQQVMCATTKYGCMNLEEIYTRYDLSTKLEALGDFLAQSNGLYQDCIAKAKTIADSTTSTIQVLQCGTANSIRNTEYRSMASDYDRLKRAADVECEQSGRLEILKLQFSKQNTPQSVPPSILQNTCPANSSLSGNKCACNDGYTYSGSGCITYTQSCKDVNNNDPNILGNVGADGKVSCSCAAGHSWNGAQCVRNVISQPNTIPPKPIATTSVKSTVRSKLSPLPTATTLTMSPTPSTVVVPTAFTEAPTPVPTPKNGWLKMFKFWRWFK